MKSFLQEYFYYSRAERNGAFILAVLCAGLFLSKIYPHFIKTEVWCGSLSGRALAFLRNPGTDSLVQRPAAEVFHFDPNTISR